MVQNKRNEEEEDEYEKFKRYSGIIFGRRIQRLKKEYIEQYEQLTGKPQEGIKIHIEFHYLLNTDIIKIIELVRESIRDVIWEQQKESLSYNETIKKPKILTLNIEQVSTEKSIDLLFTPGVIDPQIYEILRGIGIGIATYLIIEGFKKLKYKDMNLKNRNNLKKATSSRVKFIRHSDGTIEYIEGKDEFEFE